MKASKKELIKKYEKKLPKELKTYSEELFEKTFKEIEKKEKMKQQIFQNMDVMLDGEIKKIGTGGHVTMPKKYLGKKVKVIVLKDKQEDKEQES